MPSYETTVITKSNATENQVNAIKTKVEGIIQQHQGTFGIFEDWGTRRLSYEIRRRLRSLPLGRFTGNNGTVASSQATSRQRKYRSLPQHQYFRKTSLELIRRRRDEA